MTGEGVHDKLRGLGDKLDAFVGPQPTNFVVTVTAKIRSLVRVFGVPACGGMTVLDIRLAPFLMWG